jgi:hypothetical protein
VKKTIWKGREGKGKEGKGGNKSAAELSEEEVRDVFFFLYFTHRLNMTRSEVEINRTHFGSV